MWSSFLLLLVGAVTSHGYRQPGTPSNSHIGYTTITPSGSHAPITVTAQYQPIPSHVSYASTYGQYLWVSTIITDANGRKCTVTKTEQPVTIRYSSTAITHTTTSTIVAYTTPTGTHHNETISAAYQTRIWEELYEMIGEAEYRDLGPQALSSYPGSGLCDRKCHGGAGIEYQPVHVKEYKHGKWSTYNTTYTYGPPTPRATIYQTPGTYTIPAYDATLYHTTTLPMEATYTASVGSTVTYGGVTTSVSEPCTITAQYGAYTTEGAKSKLIIKTTTIYASEPGHYTIAAPTITKYDHPKECTYPTTTLYQPGVYHHSKATVTITKSNQAYTCYYSRMTSSSTPTGYLQYSATKDTYSTPMVPSRSYSGHPVSKTSSGPGSQYPTHTVSSDASRATHTPSPTNSDEYDTATPTQPQGPDPSSDYEEAEEPYGMASAGYVKRGGMLERRKAKLVAKRSTGKRVILV